MKRCRVCRDKFEPKYSSLQVTCGKISCAIEWGKSKEGAAHAGKARKRETLEMKRERRENSLSWWLNVDAAEANKNGGNTAYWLHRWIRNHRDRDKPCIMCGSDKPKGGQWNACHYRSRGAAGHLRFHPDNIQKGCAHCNTRTTGDTASRYRENLVQRIGEDQVISLETNNETRRWTIDECRELRDYYRDLCKSLEAIK